MRQLRRSYQSPRRGEDCRGMVARGLKPTATVTRSLRDDESEDIANPRGREFSNRWRWQPSHGIRASWKLPDSLAKLDEEMNPYTAPTQQSDAQDGGCDESVEHPSDHPLYALVLRMVLWGEKREDVYHSLEVNGVTGGKADQLYEHAMADRIRTIRSDCTRKLLIGVGLVVAAVVTFSLCWFGLGFIPRLLLYACFVALGVGSWKSIDGTAGYLMAPSKTGSVADET